MAPKEKEQQKEELVESGIKGIIESLTKLKQSLEEYSINNETDTELKNLAKELEQLDQKEEENVIDFLKQTEDDEKITLEQIEKNPDFLKNLDPLNIKVADILFKVYTKFASEYKGPDGKINKDTFTEEFNTLVSFDNRENFYESTVGNKFIDSNGTTSVGDIGISEKDKKIVELLNTSAFGKEYVKKLFPGIVKETKECLSALIDEYNNNIEKNGEGNTGRFNTLGNMGNNAIEYAKKNPITTAGIAGLGLLGAYSLWNTFYGKKKEKSEERSWLGFLGDVANPLSSELRWIKRPVMGYFGRKFTKDFMGEEKQES